MNKWIIHTKKRKNKNNQRYVVDYFKSLKITDIEYLHNLISSEIRYSIPGVNDDGDLPRMCRYCEHEGLNIWNLAQQAVDEINMDDYYMSRARQIQEYEDEFGVN